MAAGDKDCDVPIMATSASNSSTPGYLLSSTSTLPTSSQSDNLRPLRHFPHAAAPPHQPPRWATEADLLRPFHDPRSHRHLRWTLPWAQHHDKGVRDPPSMHVEGPSGPFPYSMYACKSFQLKFITFYKEDLLQ